MNEWTLKSIRLVNEQDGYLDNLQDVYPVTLGTPRPLTAEERAELKILFDRGKDKELLKKLLTKKKFPIKDPYVAFLRKNPKSIDKNPRTVQRITRTLHNIGFTKMVEGLETPKEFNRTIGQLFRHFLPKLGYKILPLVEFEQYNGTCILDGGDAELKNYANTKLGCNVKKGLDGIVKKGNKFIIIEAKFLTDFGGHQYAQLEDGLRLIENQEGRAIRLAVLDGVVWLDGKNKMINRIKNLKDDQIALSALLLKNFIDVL
ncbi:MAG: hypothetical protein QW478_11080 [Candidatus Micrarchaeaceae archaeon]